MDIRVKKPVAGELGAVLTYFRNKEDLFLAVSHHPVDLFIAVKPTKSRELEFIVIRKNFADYKVGKSPCPDKEDFKYSLEKLKELLDKFTRKSYQTLTDEFDEISFNEDRKEIEKTGKFLFDNLIPGEIKNFIEHEYNSIDSVWINCNPEEINPEEINPEEINPIRELLEEINFIWELLFVRSDDDFFWGDQFSISRVPNDYSFQEPKIQVIDTINAVIILNEALDYAKDEKQYLESHPRVKLEEKIVQHEDLEKLHQKNFNILHIASHYHYNSTSKKHEIGLADSSIDHKDINFNAPNKSDIVFMNTCNSEEICKVFGFHKELKDYFKNKIACIGTNWEIRDIHASNFAKYFYDSFLRGVPIAKSVKEAREKIKDKNIMWLAYTVYGHPLTRLELV